MRSHDLSLDLSVENKLDEGPEAEDMAVSLKFKTR